MIDIHWFAPVGIVIGDFGFGIGTGFRIDRKWTEKSAAVVKKEESSDA